MAKLKSVEAALADLETNGGLKVIGPSTEEVATSPSGWRAPEFHVEQPKPADQTFLGYHKFIDREGSLYGSFQVFHHEKALPGWNEWPYGGEGFYWWACHPGCLPDGDPSGPFPTAEGAYLDAIKD